MNLKKITLLAAYTLFGVSAVSAQDTMDDQAADNQQDFNRWSIELEAGVHKPTRAFAPGYYTNSPSFGQGGLGVRYMITNRFGLKLDGGYQSIESDDESLEFKSRIIRTSLQGVVNAGDIMNFREWTNTINVLFHGGLGYSVLKAEEPFEQDNDQMLNLMAGITPQVKLSDHFVITGDVSAIGNIRQSYTYDGTMRNDIPGVDGFMVNASLGLTVYLGSAEKHADWYNQESKLEEEVETLQNRLDEMESDMQDTDKDGVPNYLDREPNTMNGVAVDSKGVAVDKNGNGVPDEIEDSLDKRYAKSGANNTVKGADSGTIRKLIDEGYVNVYFQFNSTEPEPYSLQSVNYLVKYMMENEDAEAELIGYADEIGDPTYNKNLSERRAKKVHDILIAAGVDESRLSYTGNGEDNSVDKSSNGARQLVRRVTFKLK